MVFTWKSGKFVINLGFKSGLITTKYRIKLQKTEQYTETGLIERSGDTREFTDDQNLRQAVVSSVFFLFFSEY